MLRVVLPWRRERHPTGKSILIRVDLHDDIMAGVSMRTSSSATRRVMEYVDTELRTLYYLL